MYTEMVYSVNINVIYCIELLADTKFVLGQYVSTYKNSHLKVPISILTKLSWQCLHSNYAEINAYFFIVFEL